MKIGFIGAGNMGGAIIDGLLSAGYKDIAAYDLNDAAVARLKEKGVEAKDGIANVCDESDVVIIAVKPQVFDSVLPQIKNTKPIYVSIAAGISIAYMKKFLGDDAKIVRAMPNTPALIGKGVTVLSPDVNVTDDMLGSVKILFDAVGVTEIMAENAMDAVVAASGSSPHMYI